MLYKGIQLYDSHNIQKYEAAFGKGFFFYNRQMKQIILCVDKMITFLSYLWL